MDHYYLWNGIGAIEDLDDCDGDIEKACKELASVGSSPTRATMTEEEKEEFWELLKKVDTEKLLKKWLFGGFDTYDVKYGDAFIPIDGRVVER